MWTQSIAVGSEAYVREIEKQTRGRIKLGVDEVENGHWVVRETAAPYG